MNTNRQEISNRIHTLLRDPEVRRSLRETLTTAREKLTTSIRDAADLAGITQTQARYAESIHILNPRRSDQANMRAHRRYSLNEVSRLVVTGVLLKHNIPMGDIKQFFTHENSAIQDLIEESSEVDLATRLRQAEDSYLQRMLTPRLLYIAQCLLLGDVFPGSYALFLPMVIRPSAIPPITTVNDLAALGPSLVGWHSRSRPYCVLYMNEPTTDNPSRYEIRSVDELCGIPRDTSCAAELTGAYLIIEKEFAQILHPQPVDGKASGDIANPYVVARRILRFFQQDNASDQHFFGQDYSSAHDGMIYSSPEFMSHLTGDKLLTKVAELIVRLGATDPRTAEQLWTFCSILLPDETTMEMPVTQQSLVVVAQSKESRHRIGITRLIPGRQEGIALRAALSGHAIVRRDIHERDTTIAYNEVESSPGKTGNAIAMPVLDTDARPLAVIYVRANLAPASETGRPRVVSSPHRREIKQDETALTARADHEQSGRTVVFDLNDQLLLRMLGHMVGDLVASYRARYLTRESLRLMIEWPRMVDPFFRDFKSVNTFMDDIVYALDDATKALDLQETLAISPQVTSQETTQEKEAETEAEVEADDRASPVSIPLTLIAVDINQHSEHVNKYGNNTARYLVRAVGRRITEQLEVPNRELSVAQEQGNASLYHIDGDRFYILLKGVAPDQVQTYADNLSRILNKPYQLQIRRKSGVQEVVVAKLHLTDVKVRLAVTVYDRPDLRILTKPAKGADDVVSAMMRTLDQGLYQGTQVDSGNSGVVMILNNHTGSFEDMKQSSTVAPSGTAAIGPASSDEPPAPPAGFAQTPGSEPMTAPTYRHS